MFNIPVDFSIDNITEKIITNPPIWNIVLTEFLYYLKRYQY